MGKENIDKKIIDKLFWLPVCIVIYLILVGLIFMYFGKNSNLILTGYIIGTLGACMGLGTATFTAIFFFKNKKSKNIKK